MKVKLPTFRSFAQAMSGTDPVVLRNGLRDQVNPLSSQDCLQMNTLEVKNGSTGVLGHHFCSISLDADIFCDSCSCPIYCFGSEPICERCTVCHVTCHRRCAADIRIICNRGSSSEQLTNSVEDIRFNRPSEVLSDSDDELAKELATEVSQSSLNEKLGDISLDPASNYQGRVDAHLLNQEPRGSRQTKPTSLIFKTEPHSFVDCESPTQGAFDTLGQTIYYTADFPNLRCPSAAMLLSPTPNVLLRRSVHNRSSIHPTSDSTQHPFAEPVLRKSRKSKPTPVRMRHSFLAGNHADAPMSSRLAYNFSSLDRQTIKTHGIEVHEVVPAAVKHIFDSSVSGDAKSETSFPTSCSALSSVSVPSSEVGFASVMQSTVALVRTKTIHNKPSRFIPSPSPTLFSVVVGPRGRLPYTAEQLNERLSVFNANEFGLQSRLSPSLPPEDCEGQVRIHINLLRPIRMMLTVRPLSIYDLVGQEADPDDDCCSSQPELDNPIISKCNVKPVLQNPVNGIHRTQPKSSVTADAPAFSADSNAPLRAIGTRLSKRLYGSNPQAPPFWLPRGSTKLLYVRLSTTVQSVITLLLDRFQIADNPQKFALYEHTIEGEHKVSVRKLFDDESPLGLVLRWTEDGREQFNKLLGIKRLVLQENETGDIEWSGFSLPELNTFLSILNREEVDYRRRIEMKYDIRRKEILKLMRRHEQEIQASTETVDSVHHTKFIRGVCENMDQQIDSNSYSNTSETSCEIGVRENSELEDEFQSVPVDTVLTHPLEPTSRNTSTLPGFFFSKKKASTLFKPSPYKQMKKAEKAREKVSTRVEKELVKAEAKRLKSEAKLMHHNISAHHTRRLFGFPTRPCSVSGAETAEVKTTTKKN